MSYLYIVTGANGHLGNTICRQLKNHNQTVRGFILPTDSNKMLKNLGVDVYYGDIRKIESMEPLFDLNDTTFTENEIIVIHTAGIVSISQKKNQFLEAVNVGGTKNIVELSLKHNVQSFIYVSSVHAIPELIDNQVISEIESFNPDNVTGLYAKSKSKATQYVMDAFKRGLKGVIVHPSGIIGPYDFGKAHMTMMMEDYLNGYLTSRINGAYDFVDVRDVAGAIIQASYSGISGSCYILSGHRITLKELFDNMKRISGKRMRINVLPIWFARITAPLAELYYKMRHLPPIFTSYSLYTVSSNSHFSSEKARIDLNYTPRPFDETLKNTISWLIEAKRIKSRHVILHIKTLKPQKE